MRDERSPDLEFRRAVSNLSKHRIADEENSAANTPVTSEFLIAYLAMAREIENVRFTEEAFDMLVQDYVTQRERGSDNDYVTMRRTDSLARLTQAAAKLDFACQAEVRHAQFAINALASTLDTIEPSAAEGGATRHQTRRIEIIWDTLQEMHKRVARDKYTIEELVNYVAEYWESDEIDEPTRDMIIEAIQDLEIQQKSCNLGEFRRIRKGVYGFWA